MNTTPMRLAIRTMHFFMRSAPGAFAQRFTTRFGTLRLRRRRVNSSAAPCDSGTINFFGKPAHHGGVVAWYQDYSYWTRTTPMRHLTCWIGLDDATPENGCLQYAPRSHHWELLPITGLATDMDAIQDVLSDDQKAAFKPQAIPLRRGEASFHHPHLVHGSYANRTDRPRRAMVINVFMDGVRSNSDSPLLRGAPVIPKGDLMRGRFFPLLCDAP